MMVQRMRPVAPMKVEDVVGLSPIADVGTGRPDPGHVLQIHPTEVGDVVPLDPMDPGCAHARDLETMVPRGAYNMDVEILGSRDPHILDMKMIGARGPAAPGIPGMAPYQGYQEPPAPRAPYQGYQEPPAPRAPYQGYQEQSATQPTTPRPSWAPSVCALSVMDAGKAQPIQSSHLSSMSPTQPISHEEQPRYEDPDAPLDLSLHPDVAAQPAPQAPYQGYQEPPAPQAPYQGYQEPPAPRAPYQGYQESHTVLSNHRFFGTASAIYHEGSVPRLPERIFLALLVQHGVVSTRWQRRCLEFVPHFGIQMLPKPVPVKPTPPPSRRRRGACVVYDDDVIEVIDVETTEDSSSVSQPNKPHRKHQDGFQRSGRRQKRAAPPTVSPSDTGPPAAGPPAAGPPAAGPG